MERHFERELDELKANLVAMGKLVDEQLTAASDALFAGDVAKAGKVILADARVDEYDTLIDRQCQQIFALAQPVAIDLRLLMSALKINGQIERIGDIAVNIAERVQPLAPYLPFLAKTRLSDMSLIARIMVRDSLDAFMYSNPQLATRVLDSDDVVDRTDADLFAFLVREMQEHHELIEPAAHLLILSRHIERLADHATNIAEDVIFLVEARLVKHNASEVEQR